MDKNKLFYSKIILKIAFFLTAGFLLTGMVSCTFMAGPLDKDGYAGALYTNYDLTYFTEEEFLSYRGLKIYTEYDDFTGLTDMVNTIKNDINKNRSLKQSYIALHPVAGEDELDALIQVVKKEKDVTFEILLSAPSLSYLSLQTQDWRDAYFDAAAYLLEGLKECQNVYVYYVGNQEWLILNPANYETEMGFHEVIAEKMLCATFCDRLYQVSADTFGEKKEETIKLLANYEGGGYIYPDLSEYQLVFLGDSIMGNYKGSFSIPGMVAGLTGAESFNCGEGGVCAAQTTGSDWSAYRMAVGLTEESKRLVSEKGQYSEGAKHFTDAFDKSKKTVIFVEYGINDYLQQIPVGSAAYPEEGTEYYGALHMTIERLQQDYPFAEICILTPTFVLEDAAEGISIDDYARTAGAVADDLNVSHIDMNMCLGIAKEEYGSYLEDECHLNEKGRLAYANVLIQYLTLADLIQE